MIQVYSPSNTDYTHNGNAVLFAESCEISAELKGPWSLTLTHPLDDEGRWKNIEENAVLKVPTWMANKSQLYRIRAVEKTMDGITVQAYPVFYDSAGDFYIKKAKVTAKNVLQTLRAIFAFAPIKYDVDVTGTTTGRKSYEFLDVNGMAALDVIRDQWGVEYLYDNYKLWVAEKQGVDRGVTVEYGKNITGVDYTVDMSEVVTRVYPYAYNGHCLSTSYINSGLIGSYPIIYARPYQFNHIKMSEDATDSDAEDESIIICESQAELDDALEAAVEELFATGIDKPKVSMAIDMLALEATEEYKGYSGLEMIRLGDTVHCRHAKLGIVSDARVVGIRWDCARDRIAGVTLGEFAYDYFRDNSALTDIQRGLDQLAGNFNGDGTIMAERVRGILNGMYTRLSAQYTAADRTDKMAILFENTDPTSPLYGALGIGTQGLQIADTVDGQGNWVWTTALTAKAGLLGSIITGLIADATGHNYWDLDTGEMKIGDTVLVDDLTGHVVISAKDSNDVETFYVNSETGVVRIRASQFSLSSGETLQDVLEKALSYADRNLLKGSMDFSDEFWKVTGTLQHGQTDPKGGTSAHKLLSPSSGEAGITAKSNNKPFPVTPASYRISVWLKASNATAAEDNPIGIYLNNVQVGTVSPTKTWAQYHFDAKITSVSDVGWVNIGGGRTFTSSSGWDCYVYNPCVEIITDSYLSKENIFNQLTDNGENNGVFMLENGEMYINFTYAHGGTLKLGGLDNTNGIFKVFDANGNEIVVTDKDGTRFCTTRGWANENIRIDENIIKGFIGDNLYSFIDTCANFETESGLPRYWFVIETTTYEDGIKLVTPNGTIALDTGNGTIDLTGHINASNPPWNPSSDIRLKKNIIDADDQTGNLKKLKVHAFDWKNKDGHVPAGLVAQELQEVYPELVKKTSDGLTIDYINMVPYLIKTIQEQEKRVSALEETVEKLEKRLADLEGR